MKVTKNENKTIIELAGRIDSGNAQDLEKELLEFLGSHCDEEIVFDAERLSYISSAGLREMKDEQTVVHGDIQMKNVMMVDNEPMLIDMDTLGQGNPVFDLAGLYVTYHSFEEDDPDNGMSFLQMPNEEADRLLDCIIEDYFDFRDDAVRQRTIDQIALVAAIRFLFLLETTELKESDLGRKRIEHTVTHIEELLETVTSLAIYTRERN